MPFSVPIIAALIGAATAGTTTGLELAGVGKPSQGDALKQQQQQQEEMLKQEQIKKQQQDQVTKAEAFKSVAPDVQGQVGGSLTPESFSQMVASLTGNPGDLGLAQKTLFGGSASGGGASGLTGEGLFSGMQPSSGSSGAGLSDVIKKLFSGGGEGSMEPSLAG